MSVAQLDNTDFHGVFFFRVTISKDGSNVLVEGLSVRFLQILQLQ